MIDDEKKADSSKETADLSNSVFITHGSEFRKPMSKEMHNKIADAFYEDEEIMAAMRHVLKIPAEPQKVLSLLKIRMREKFPEIHHSFSGRIFTSLATMIFSEQENKQ